MEGYETFAKDLYDQAVMENPKSKEKINVLLKSDINECWTTRVSIDEIEGVMLAMSDEERILFEIECSTFIRILAV